MDYLITTAANEDSWQDVLNWMRKAKSNSLKGFVVDNGLSEDHINKANELGFPVVKQNINYKDNRDVYNAISGYLQPGQACCLTTPHITPVNLELKGDLLTFADSKLDLFCVVTCVRNLKNRAKAYQQIKSKFSEDLVSSKIMLGTHSFWKKFALFQNICFQADFIETREHFEELSLNLFLSLSNLNFGVQK